MSKRRKKQKLRLPLRFKVGDRVRVKHGFRDEAHPDIPLGGWAGTVCGVDGKGIYTVRWSRETLAAIHPLYRKRCAIDGELVAEYGLGDSDLEPDSGGPLAIEQPTEIKPRPLSNADQGDRVRMVFGLTTDDFLPDVDDDSLETYYDFLKGWLSLPAEAKYDEDVSGFFDSSRPRWGKILALDCELYWDEDEGIFCKVRTVNAEETVPLADLRFRRNDPNRQLLDDYVAWFAGDLSEDDEDEYAYDTEFEDDEEEFEDDEEETDEEEEDTDWDEDETDASEELERFAAEAGWGRAALVMLWLAAIAASYGAIVGAVATVMPWARWAACVCGGVWGAFMAVATAVSPQEEMPYIAPAYRKPLATLEALILGALSGAFFGVMVVAFVGSVLGGLAGLLFKRLAPRKKSKKKSPFGRFLPGPVLLAAVCGATAQAFYMDRAAATAGLGYGALIALACGLFFYLVALPLGYVTVRRV